MEGGDGYDEDKNRHLNTSDLSVDQMKKPLINTASDISGGTTSNQNSFGVPPKLNLAGMASPASPTTLKNADADVNIKPSEL